MSKNTLHLIIISVIAAVIVLLIASGLFYIVAIYCGIAAWAIAKVNKDRS